MAGESPKYEWYAKNGGCRPIDDGWQVAPKRQVRAVVDIERREHHDEGRAHSAGMDSQIPAAARRQSRNDTEREGDHAECEKMNVVRPSHGGQRCCRRKQRSKAPEVNGTHLRVPPTPLWQPHREQAGYDGRQSSEHMQCDDPEK